MCCCVMGRVCTGLMGMDPSGLWWGDFPGQSRNRVSLMGFRRVFPDDVRYTTRMFLSS